MLTSHDESYYTSIKFLKALKLTSVQTVNMLKVAFSFYGKQQIQAQIFPFNVLASCGQLAAMLKEAISKIQLSSSHHSEVFVKQYKKRTIGPIPLILSPPLSFFKISSSITPYISALLEPNSTQGNLNRISSVSLQVLEGDFIYFFKSHSNKKQA